MSRALIDSKKFIPRGKIAHENPPVVRFSADGRGLPLVALKNKNAQVTNGSLPALEGSGATNPSITFRPIWPGYTHDFTARTINSSSKNRIELASAVATVIANYVFDIRKQKVASTDPSFGIVERGIWLEDLYLEGIVNTSGTCWQPILYYESSSDSDSGSDSDSDSI